MTPLNDKIKPGPHARAELHSLRAREKEKEKKGVCFSLIGLGNGSGEMEHMGGGGLNRFYWV